MNQKRQKPAPVQEPAPADNNQKHRSSSSRHVFDKREEFRWRRAYLGGRSKLTAEESLAVARAIASVDRMRGAA